MKKKVLFISSMLRNWSFVFALVTIFSFSINNSYGQNDCSSAVSQSENTISNYETNEEEFWIKLSPSNSSIYVALSESTSGSLPPLIGMELFEGVCSSLTSIKTVDFSTGDSAFYLDNINSQNEYYLKVYQSSATNGHFGVFYTSASTPPTGLLCPISDCNLVPNGGFETLSPLVLASTQVPNYVYSMTDITLPNDNVCGWIKGGNTSPLLYGSSAGPNHSVLISGTYWTPPYGGTASTIYTEINNGTPLTQGESYLLRFWGDITIPNGAGFEIGLTSTTNNPYSSSRSPIIYTTINNTASNITLIPGANNYDFVFTVPTFASTYKYLYSFIVNNQIYLDDIEIVPAMAGITGDHIICEGDQTQLEAFVCLDGEDYLHTYLWTSSPFDGSLTNDPFYGDQTPNIRVYVSPKQTTTYTCNVTYNNGMTGAKSVTVTVNPMPDQAELSGVFHSCGANPVTYTIDNSIGNCAYEYEIIGYTGPNPISGNQFNIDWSQYTPFNNGRVEMRIIATDIYSNCLSDSIYDVYDCCSNGSPIIWTDERLSNNPQVYYGQDIEINGVLTVEAGVILELGDCEIRMGGGAKIIIKDDADISFDNVHMFSCDQLNMWDGIYLEDINSGLTATNNSIFEDARNVIVADNGAVFTVENCIFDKNIVGIIAQNYNGYYSASVYNSSFRKSASNLLYPFTPTTGTLGIIINNITSNIVIGNNTTANVQNNFNGLSTGLLSDNSNFQAYNNIFTECGIGIDAIGNTNIIEVLPEPARIITIGGENKYYPNEFISCGTRGIRIFKKADIDIINNSFDYCYWGIEIENNTYTEILVKMNTIDNTAYKGISTYYTSSDIEIFGNHIITTSASNDNFGIVAAENNNLQYPAYTAVTRIYENNIDNVRRGIHVSRAEGLSISANAIDINSQVVTNLFGIYVSDVDAPDIKYNTVQLYNSTAQPVQIQTYYLEGIRLMNSNNGFIRRNNIYYMGVGIVTSSNCLPTEISCNYLYDNYYGVKLDNAQIGNQGAAGMPWDNEWYNSTANAAFLRVQGTIPSTANPIYWYCQTPNNYTLVPNPTYISVSPPSKLITSYSSTGNHCQTAVPPAVPPSQAILPAQQGGQQVTQASLISQRDKQLGQLVNSFFPSSISLSQSGNYIAYQVFNYSDDYEKVRYIYQVLKENPTYLNLGTINDYKYQNLMSFLTSSNIASFYTVEQYIQQHKDSLAISQLSQVSPVNSMETDFKIVLDLYIKHQSRPLNGQDSSVLLIIANKNAHNIGNAAFIARNLLGLCIVDQYTTNASIIRMANTEKSIRNNNSMVKVYPNPTKNQITIEFTQKNEGFAQIIIYNMLGQEVLNKYFDTNRNAQINTSALDAGVYFYKIIKNNEILNNDKLIKL